MQSVFFWEFPRRLKFKSPGRWNRQGVPKRRLLNFRRRGNSQKNTDCNDQLDATPITQMSNEDRVAVEVRSEAVKFFGVSKHFDSRRDIETYEKISDS